MKKPAPERETAKSVTFRLDAETEDKLDTLLEAFDWPWPKKRGKLSALLRSLIIEAG